MISLNHIAKGLTDGIILLAECIKEFDIEHNQLRPVDLNNIVKRLLEA